MMLPQRDLPLINVTALQAYARKICYNISAMKRALNMTINLMKSEKNAVRNRRSAEEKLTD